MAPGSSSDVAIVETHVSVLLFIGDHVYKLKKPISLDFIDLTTREARETACHREVELNRRLAPDVYLGVLDISDPEGRPCDHLVAMRRLPADRRLSVLLATEGPADAILDQVARLVVALHGASSAGVDLAVWASAEAVDENWKANLREVRHYVGTILDEDAVAQIEVLADRYLAGRHRLFAERVNLGRAVDGHGDLQAEDIFCLDDGVRILDCLEFDDRLRYGDAVADIAFLAMDLERLGHRRAAARFLRAYSIHSGDDPPSSLTDHYVGYRTLVRAKVACLRHAPGHAGTDDLARTLSALCLRHLRSGAVRLVLVGGLPGTGKSTVAAGVAGSAGWSLVRSDVVRKELASLSGAANEDAGFGEGLYTPELTRRTYHELLSRARALLEMGRSVVLDATWSSADAREAARQLAADTVSDMVELKCVAPPNVAARRMAMRRIGGADPSDANPEVASAMAARAAPWPEAFVLDTTGTPDEVVGGALEHLEALDGLSPEGRTGMGT